MTNHNLQCPENYAITWYKLEVDNAQAIIDNYPHETEGLVRYRYRCCQVLKPGTVIMDEFDYNSMPFQDPNLQSGQGPTPNGATSLAFQLVACPLDEAFADLALINRMQLVEDPATGVLRYEMTCLEVAWDYSVAYRQGETVEDKSADLLPYYDAFSNHMLAHHDVVVGCYADNAVDGTKGNDMEFLLFSQLILYNYQLYPDLIHHAKFATWCGKIQ